MQAIDFMQVERIGAELQIQQRKMKMLSERLQDVCRKTPSDTVNEIVGKKLFRYLETIRKEVYDYQQMRNTLSIVEENYDRTERQIMDFAEESENIPISMMFRQAEIPKFVFRLLR